MESFTTTPTTRPSWMNRIKIEICRNLMSGSIKNSTLMFALFFLLSTAWCGRVFIHAASPVLMNMEAGAEGDAKSIVGVTLPPLPYAYNALEPHLGEETLHIHHDKHHAKV